VALRESFARDPRDEFVEKLRTHSLIEATESARRLGAWRCANLERFFSELRDSLADGEDPHVLVRRLRIAIASEEEGEEARPQEILAEAVSVMTIHGAKGLDFEHVYVMQLHKGSAGSDDTGVAAESAGGFEFRLFGSPSLAWDAVADRRAAITEAERVRLLYVAMTRAKRRLVLAGVRKEHQKRTSRGQTVDLLRHRDGGEDALSARMREAAGAATGTGAVADAFGARWYFPAQASPAPDKVPGKPTVEAPAATEAEAEAEWRASDVELAGHCERARARMERPVSAAASSVAHASESRPRGGGSRAHADAARRIGTAIHAVLEEFDFEADRKQEIDSQRQRFAEAVSRWDDGASIETALALFDRVVQGACFARLCALSSHIIARELSVLLPPAVPLPSDGEAGPVGYFSGTIDLLYADPDTGRWVVADYKTDGIETDDDRAQRTEIYTKQGAVYCRAVRDALGLEALPRFELWFLSPDEIVDASLPDDSQADPRIGSTDAVEALVAKRRTGNES
jgi:ATP-dependent helicase/nuclease subunit A